MKNDFEYIMSLIKPELPELLTNIDPGIISIERDSECIINIAQLEKFLTVLNFFFICMKKDEPNWVTNRDAYVEPIHLDPKHKDGEIRAHFITFEVSDLFDERKKVFSKLLSYASSFTVERPNSYRVCVSFVVPGIFIQGTNDSSANE